MTPEQSDLIERLRTLLLREPITREVSMFGGRSFMVNEKMIVSALKDGNLLVRVAADRHEELLHMPGVVGLVEMAGVTDMTEISGTPGAYAGVVVGAEVLGAGIAGAVVSVGVGIAVVAYSGAAGCGAFSMLAEYLADVFAHGAIHFTI